MAEFEERRRNLLLKYRFAYRVIEEALRELKDEGKIKNYMSLAGNGRTIRFCFAPAGDVCEWYDIFLNVDKDKIKRGNFFKFKLEAKKLILQIIHSPQTPQDIA